MKSLIPLITLGLSLNLAAANVDSHFDQLQRLSTLSADTIEQTLTRYPTTQQIDLTQQLIKHLRQQQTPTSAQYQWVQQQSHSQHKRTAKLTDGGHQRSVTVINIAAQAKGLLARWQSIKQAQQWLAQVKRNQFDWASLLQNELDKPQLAIITFVQGLATELSTTQQSQLTEQLLAQSDLQPSNLLLSQLADAQQHNSGQKQQLYHRLWSSPADEFSLQALQSLVKHERKLAIQQLTLAMENHQLTSLSLNLLATYYADEPAVIEMLFNLLGDNHKGAYAAAALAKAPSQVTKDKLGQVRYSPDNRRRQSSQLALDLISKHKPLSHPEPKRN